MCASISIENTCALCKNRGIFTCHGCEKHFCGKHSVDHRRELDQQLDVMVQDLNEIRNKTTEQINSEDYGKLLKQIDNWHAESMAKINSIATDAKKRLELLKKQKEDKFNTAFFRIQEDIRRSKEAEDFDEVNIKRWKSQSKSFLKQVTSSMNSFKIALDVEHPILPIHITESTESQASDKQKANEKPTIKTQEPRKDIPKNVELFFSKTNNVRLTDSNMLCQHVGDENTLGYILGRLLYQAGCWDIDLKIEQCLVPYKIFFGCTTSTAPLENNLHATKCAVGWFSYEQVYEHGRCSSNAAKYKYKSSTILPGDEIRITFDLNKRKIHLLQKRISASCSLNINTDLIPPPWRLLVALGHPGDSVRILSNGMR